MKAWSFWHLFFRSKEQSDLFPTQLLGQLEIWLILFFQHNYHMEWEGQLLRLQRTVQPQASSSMCEDWFWLMQTNKNELPKFRPNTKSDHEKYDSSQWLKMDAWGLYVLVCITQGKWALDYTFLIVIITWIA